MKSNTGKIVFITFFCIYFGFPLVRDVFPFHLDYSLEDWFALLGMYILGMGFALPLFIFLLKNRKAKKWSDKREIFSAIVGVALQMVILAASWKFSVTVYLFMALTPLSIFFLLAFKRDKCRLLRDVDTGTFYKVKGNRISPLSAGDMYFQEGKHVVADFSSSSIPGFDGSASVVAFDSTSFFRNGSDYASNTIINPSSGMPMIGGVSGLDVHGNSFGTNLNEPISNYDPNRGY